MCARSIAVKVAPGSIGNVGSTSHMPALASGMPAVLGTRASVIASPGAGLSMRAPPPAADGSFMLAVTVTLPSPLAENHASRWSHPEHAAPAKDEMSGQLIVAVAPPAAALTRSSRTPVARSIRPNPGAFVQRNATTRSLSRCTVEVRSATCNEPRAVFAVRRPLRVCAKSPSTFAE